MRKTRLFWICVLLIAFTGILLVGCSKEDKISAVYLKDSSPDSVIEIAVGEFDFGAYTLVLQYNSGKTEELPLTEDMISAVDLFKLYQPGEHDVTVVYGKHKCVFKISVKRSTFGALSFPENNVFTYDGKAHAVEVQGDLPANAVITYPGGNSFVNAGTYDVTAIVSCEGYVSVKLATTVKIERAKYDMSAVSFEAKEVVYDGKTHSVAISGTLPEGVTSPIYTINEKVTSGASDVGVYTVKATFTTKNSNYEPIPDMTTTLTITPAEYKLIGVGLVFSDEGGAQHTDMRKVYNGTAVNFELTNFSKFSGKVYASYSVYDSEGKLISTANKNTGILNAGLYTVKVEFTLADSKNYKAIDPIVYEFEVEKADYNLDLDVHLDSDTLIYDGQPHSLAIDGELPAGVSVSYEYYLGDTLVLDADSNPAQSVTDTGRYSVKAVFTHTDVNYKEISPISATLYVSRATLVTNEPASGFYEQYVYDGTAKSFVTPVLDTVPEGITISYEYYLDGVLLENSDGTPVTSVTEVGLYTVKILINITNPNYFHIGEIEATLMIIAPNN